ncbi:1,2-phenylacetyl-CoA epoxidase subunit PaaD [Acidiphilium sp.]|uniref:1,2-phenylacetyl-CoA epoxidase subunit PaaD n=1 Tax=Acidiphilium sp. TaxID=527 RepID=UPI003CFDB894
MSDVCARARRAVAAVTDPELPMLTIAEMGILRDVALIDGVVEVTITPTYSGCPALSVIGEDIAAALRAAGIGRFRIRHTLTPAWTSDWLSPDSRAKLAAAGIAPPMARRDEALFEGACPPCPRCGAVVSEAIARFGTTACKSLWRCTVCREPFDHFKCH